MARGFRGFRRESSLLGDTSVTYYVDVGVSYTEDVPQGKTVLSPQSFTPTKSGYTFLGWKDSGIASSDVLINKKASGKTMSIYAVFVKTVTLTYYNSNNTANTDSNNQYYNNADTLNPSFTLPAQIELSGWTTRGWTTGSTGDATITHTSGVEFELAVNTEISGCYEKNVTVSYNGNGATSGSTADSTGTAYYHSSSGGTNASITLSANGYTKTSYNFVQWRLNSVSGTVYAPGATYSSTEDATMYAEWKVKAVAKTFNYTGGMQSYVAYAGVTYKIQVYGAQGGSVSGATGGNGGYSIGYRKPSSNETWYIGVGGQGATFNGGGVTNSGGNGGGASHVSLQNAQIVSSSLGNIIAIAGGGGGCGSDWSTIEHKPWHGGTGGGTNGGNGTYQNDGKGHYSGFGGTQSAGGSGAYYTNDPSNKGNSGSYGKGGNGRTIDSSGILYGGGGGGGLYGGGGGHYLNGVQAGGGGSGTTRGMTSAGMSNGQKTGNGQVIITPME